MLRCIIKCIICESKIGCTMCRRWIYTDSLAFYQHINDVALVDQGEGGLKVGL